MSDQHRDFYNSLKDLSLAFQGYAKSVQESRAKDIATQTAESASNIKKSVDDDMTKRGQLTDLINEAKMRIALAGGTDKQIAAVSTLAPPIPSSAEQAVLMGRATGNQGLVNIGMRSLMEEQARATELLSTKMAAQLAKEQASGEVKEDIQGKKLSSTQLSSLQKDFDKNINLLKDSTANADRQIKLVDNAISAVRKAGYTTGPVAQYLTGLTVDGQRLESALSRLSVDKLVADFRGMSKTIDSDAERKIFEASLGRAAFYKDVNLAVLKELKTAALVLKRNNLTKEQALKASTRKNAENILTINGQDPESKRYQGFINSLGAGERQAAPSAPALNNFFTPSK